MCILKMRIDNNSNTMLRETTKQLMDKSAPFRLLFWGTIVLFSIAILLSIIFPFTTCYNSSYYLSCSWYNSYYYYECSDGFNTYCCSTSSYSYCGSSYCILKPNSYNYGRACMGVIIAAWVLYGVSFLMAVGVFIMFCNLRDKARQGAYANLAVIPNNAIIYNQPVNYQAPPLYGNPVMYSDNQGFAPPVRNIA